MILIGFNDFKNNMARLKQTNIDKIKNYIQKYPSEFCEGPKQTLYCNICNTCVDFSKKFNVDAHRKTKGHVVPTKNVKIQTFFTDVNEKFTARVVDAFVSADIPLEKLRNQKLRDLFTHMKYKLPSETNARRYVNKLAISGALEIQKLIENMKIFIVFDETEILGKKYCNIMCGSIARPGQIWLLKTIPISTAANSTLVVSLIDEALESYNICSSNFVLLISDAAAYMKKAGNIFKERNRNLLHVKCIAHLIHNCSMRIRASYPNIDNLISSLKMMTTKNRERRSLFSNLGPLPSVVLTRWSSWLRAAMFYCENLCEIKKIVMSIKDEGILIKKAKASVLDENLIQSLVLAKECYEPLINILDNLEKGSYTNLKAYQELLNIDLKYDPLQIKEYIMQRISDNDIKVIHDLSNDEITPACYAELRSCPPTSIVVERSFSMLKKLLTVGRNFDENNITDYMQVYYNSHVLQENAPVMMEEDADTDY